MSPVSWPSMKPCTDTFGGTAIADSRLSLSFVPRSTSASTSWTTGKGPTSNVAAMESCASDRTRNTCSPTGQSGAISNTHLSDGFQAAPGFSGGLPIGSTDTTRMPGR
jgi:hypothetical protein